MWEEAPALPPGPPTHQRTWPWLGVHSMGPCRSAGLQLLTSGSPPISAPSFLCCQQQLSAADGQQSHRGPADLFSGSIDSPIPC